ncbi:methylmalonyl-CoA mutase family protein [Pseudonocardia cypriaca]|uniref:methylmalonyl-CoA mutase n=1 Tax=Pseudonocardia cypriaca TaxID=882449 RepID=A0A543GH50_9PSEU|nr:methylmalonyl-CoA mutase family protein [Pseudonocardia cypriaca]TQM45412.1 heterodimeric methylmalonyl-CoA mutase small subunit [Pseudonocardia cypriaca]
MDTAPSGTAGTAQVDGDALDAQAPPEPEELALAAEFPEADRADWLALVDQVVRKAGKLPENAEPGAGFDRLTGRTLDDIPVRPLYTAGDAPDPDAAGVPGAAPYVRGGRANGPAPAGWDVRQRHADPDPAAARGAVLADLENGVSSIWLAVGAGGTAVADLGAVLDGVHLDLAPVVLDASGDSADTELAAADAFLGLAADRGVPPADLLGTLGLDPVGRRARTGDGPEPDAVVPLAVRVAKEFPRVRAVVVDALPVHGAGASDAQELGFSLAAGVAYLRALTAAGLDLPAAAGLIEFRYAATAEQFPTIAKLRAARLLWSRVTQACGAASPQFQHAVGSPSMLTRRDVHGNLLRGTVAGFAAGIGGADAVTVAPFDAALGGSGPFSRRIARNTQSLLVQEAHLARVIDPAGGSWFVESLTRELAAAAWAFFQEIEAAGGVLAALDAGLVAERVAVVRGRREEAAARRTAPIVGVSEYADPGEIREPAGDPGPPPAGLPRFRPAERYEAYRDRSDALLAETGSRPRAFLATLGPLAAYTPRAGFARNLLQAGGIETPEAGPTETSDEVVAAFREAGTPVAVLCAPDALYAERAEETVAALRAAGARYLLLAGTAEVPGVDGNLAAGCDALAVIESVHRALEVQP